MSEVLLPALGESVTEGTVTRWLKKVGETVAVDEPLVEVSTDKVDTEIPSPFAGVLTQILVQEDETVGVGTALAVIGEASAASPAESPAAPAVEAPATPAVTAPVATPVATPVEQTPIAVAPIAAPSAVAITPSPAAPIATVGASVPSATSIAASGTEDSDPNYVTPIVRKLANDHGVNLALVKGTGVGGRIRKEDVLAAAQQSSLTSSPQAAPRVIPATSPLRGTSEPMSRLRKVLAERAVASMQGTAQLTTVVEVDVTEIANLRKSIQAQFTAATGTKLTFMPFFTLAAAEALKAHPKINSSVDGENIVYHPTENISFAVDTERGLLTPVIRSAGDLTIAEIAKQISDLASRTRSNQLKPDELSGGTFTLTNTGSRGALFDTPVVFLPQSAILGTGIVAKRPAVVTDSKGNEAIAIRSLVYLALSYDHRTIDGADASRFLMDVKSRLEEANFGPNLGI